MDGHARQPAQHRAAALGDLRRLLVDPGPPQVFLHPAQALIHTGQARPVERALLVAGGAGGGHEVAGKVHRLRAADGEEAHERGHQFADPFAADVERAHALRAA